MNALGISTFLFIAIAGVFVSSAEIPSTTPSPSAIAVEPAAPAPAVEPPSPSTNYTDEDVQRILAEFRTKEANKLLVTTFYQATFGDKDISAVDKYIDNTTYIQHNPHVADGAEALKKALAIWFPPGTPKTKVDFQRVGADGDLVFLHIKSFNKDGTLHSLVDIFKVKDGKIVEHWDTMQDADKDLEAKNDHPFF